MEMIPEVTQGHKGKRLVKKNPKLTISWKLPLKGTQQREITHIEETLLVSPCTICVCFLRAIVPMTGKITDPCFMKPDGKSCESKNQYRPNIFF
jgi:hypothetical protein